MVIVDPPLYLGGQAGYWWLLCVMRRPARSGLTRKKWSISYVHSHHYFMKYSQSYMEQEGIMRGTFRYNYFLPPAKNVNMLQVWTSKSITQLQGTGRRELYQSIDTQLNCRFLKLTIIERQLLLSLCALYPVAPTQYPGDGVGGGYNKCVLSDIHCSRLVIHYLLWEYFTVHVNDDISIAALLIFDE